MTAFGKHPRCTNPACWHGMVTTVSRGPIDCYVCEAHRAADMRQSGKRSDDVTPSELAGGFSRPRRGRPRKEPG